MIKGMKVRKALGVAMTTAMVFTMAMPTFASGVNGDSNLSTPTYGSNAAENTWTYATDSANIIAQKGTIRKMTINKSVTGHKYYAYQIFAGDLSLDNAADSLANNTANAGGLMLANIEWGSGIDATKTVGGKTIYEALLDVTGFKNAWETIKSEINGTTNPARAAAFATVDDVKEVAEIIGKMSDDSDALQAVGRVFSSFRKDAAASVEGKTGEAVSMDVPVGYYMVEEYEDDWGDNVVPDGTNALTRIVMEVVGDSSANIKTTTVESEKKVQEDDREIGDDGYGDKYNDVADYTIGENVPFEIIAVLPDVKEIKNYLNAYKYQFVDTMSDGLDFVESSVVVTIVDGTAASLDSAPVKVTLVKDTDYNIVKHTADHGFDLTIPNLKAILNANENVVTGDKVLVRFEATLNENANLGTDVGNDNKSKLIFSNNPNGEGEGETPEDRVIVFTYGIDNTKVDQDGAVLDGAKFKLYRINNGTEEYVYLKDVTPQTGATRKEYVIDKDAAGTTLGWGAENGATEVETIGGKFLIKGLDEGTYYLKETVTPTGYNSLTDDIIAILVSEVEHTQNWNMTDPGQLVKDGSPKVSYGNKADYVNGSWKEGSFNAVDQAGDKGKGEVYTQIINQKGAVLPSTGGMGTTLFYAIGGVLLVGAAVLLVTRKRVEA